MCFEISLWKGLRMFVGCDALCCGFVVHATIDLIKMP